MLYLYMRVSDEKQELEAQEHALGKKYPHGLVYKETARGLGPRPKLQELLSIVRPGDMIAVSSLDRLGRKMLDIVALLEKLHKDHVAVVSLREGIDYGSPAGRMMAQLLASVAELERALIGQRTKAALEAKRAAGMVFKGRPRLKPETRELAHKMREEGASLNQIHEATGISVRWLCVMFKRKDAEKKAS